MNDIYVVINKKTYEIPKEQIKRSSPIDSIFAPNGFGWFWGGSLISKKGVNENERDSNSDSVSSLPYWRLHHSAGKSTIGTASAI